MKEHKLRAGETLFCWLLLAFSLFILYQAYLISGFDSVSSPGAFPMAAGAVMVLSMLVIVGKNATRSRAHLAGWLAELAQARRSVLTPVVVVYALMIGAYMLLMEPLGFIGSTFLFLLVSLLYLRRSAGFIRALLISAGSLAAIYVVFHYIFRVILP